MALLVNVMAIRRSRVSLLGMYIILMLGIILSLRSMHSISYMNEGASNDSWINRLTLEFDKENERQRPSVILFTTFKNQPDRLFLQYNTIRNWASLRPFVQPVLFTTSRRGDGTELLEQVARDSGWHLYPAPSVNNNGLPFVRPMFEFVELRYNDAMFRGFSNGDLLFDDSLKKTLQAIGRNVFHLKRAVLVGNHTVYGGSFLNEKNTVSKDLLRAKMEKAGSKTNGSKGYIVISGYYPWETFPGLVVGRHGLHNVIMNLAAMYGAKIIDATKALLAVHQSVKNDAKPTGKDIDFNVDAVKEIYGLANASLVNTTPAHYLVAADFLGNMHIVNNSKSQKPAKKVAIAVIKKVDKKPDTEKKSNIEINKKPEKEKKSNIKIK